MTTSSYSPARRARPVTEVRTALPSALVHPGWADRFPWLVHGTTLRAAGGRGFDLGLFSDGSGPDTVRDNWSRLARETGATRVVHAQQVHGCDVHLVLAGEEPSRGPSPMASEDAGSPVPTLLDPADGHLTAEPGVLLAVTAADCVPVLLVDAERRTVGAVHAGWRGAAAGILERALEALASSFGARIDDVHVHLGPAICGSCYEVGPEVFEALGLAVPGRPEPVDLRAALADRAHAAGVPAESISVSTWCTRCGDAGLFSHRGGDRGRHVGFIGIRATDG